MTDTKEFRHFINEIARLLVVLLPYVALGLWAYSIQPDLVLLPALPLFAGISISGMLKQHRLIVFVIVCTALAFVAAAVWVPAAGGIVAASGAVRIFTGARSKA